MCNVKKLNEGEKSVNIITKDGKTTPKVAHTPPATPFFLVPINVAVLTAITPGVHCPKA